MKLQIIFLSLLFISFFGRGQSIEKFSIDSGGASATAGNINVFYTLGEVNVQERSAGNIQISEGFINGSSLAISVNPKIFLQGPLADPATVGLMNDDLRSAAEIPTTSPYPDGITCNSSVFTTTGNDAIVDWVLVELRDAADFSLVIESRSALLQRDGDVVDIDGLSDVTMVSAAADYYVSINHRNHLGILSAAPVSLSSGTVIDLSADPMAIYGGTNAVADMGGGIFALFGGDFNGDKQIQASDSSGAISLTGQSGYTDGDANMNGEIQATDITLIIKPNIGKGQQFN